MSPSEKQDNAERKENVQPAFPMRYVVYAIIAFIVVFNLGLALRTCSPA